jgi:hypothetical protein
VAVPPGVACGSPEISQQFGGPVFAEFGDGVSVRTVGGRVEVREQGDDAVPAQQFKE